MVGLATNTNHHDYYFTAAKDISLPCIFLGQKNGFRMKFWISQIWFIKWTKSGAKSN
ncbi:hypothetical protein BT96DRAFT_566076 [Gymnopus androsaceus JB14]|uniref:Uncharacterized protein n=1 Tax=Gymnopus androsaceus JB14 TaxID=1447944 RepID=A0A6A4HSH8_9AGAR|nr:hypothetical protein BT96DRAFT_566076 [Gymnopus androsaceus JB14]